MDSVGSSVSEPEPPGNLTSFDVFSKVNKKYDLHVLVHVLKRILDNS